MASVAHHYQSLLAPIYVWMAGGLDAAMARGQAEMDALGMRPTKSRLAVDLGAGFGMHTVPMADSGYSVLALDNSATLLEILRSQVGTRSIRIVNDDLMSFGRYVAGPVAIIVCMGDTLAHLPDLRSVEELFAGVAQVLEEGGTFLMTFRDYSIPLEESDRFILVRSDADRILTCFLEYEEKAVIVHDILHERDGSGWRKAAAPPASLLIDMFFPT